MQRRVARSLGLLLAGGLVIGGAGTAIANPNPPVDTTSKSPLAKSTAATAAVDNLPNPQDEKRSALRKAAIADVLSGRAKAVKKNGSVVVKVGTKTMAPTAAQRRLMSAGTKVAAKKVDQYVELTREKTDRIFVVLAEFGNERHPNYPDQDTDPDTPGPTVFDGPLHNAIPEPDRSKDNSTGWLANYSPEHYRQLYFGKGAGVESLRTYYEKQSSGRYSVNGEVTDWVKVRYNEARYGRSNGYPCGGIVCSNTWNLIADSVNKWVADQKAKGRTDAQIKADLATFDQWDRYDYDGDGNFNEPDGYIDHFQVVHAGGDQADGDPYQGEDAIWSHRWYAFVNQAGTTGPTNNLLGGTQIGTSGLWVGDYTIQPENGGLSVFAHEYGHDLGLPDLYDTSGPPSSLENGVNWWSIMSQSRVSAKNDDSIDSRAADFGAWDKLFLGWLDYEIAVAGQKKTYKLGPHEYNSAKPQALAVVLPQKSVTTALVPPASGTKQWWSGSADNLTATLARSVALPAGTSTLNFKAAFDIEEGYDYAVVEVKDGAANWVSVPTSLSNPKAVVANGIDGASAGYKSGTADLSAYAGKAIQLRFRYTTDGGVAGNDDNTGNNGLFLDDISVTNGSTTLFTDNVENGTAGWTAAGFTVVGSTITTKYDNYYLASYRAYVSFDKYLKTGPYNFGFANTLPDKVEKFPYQNGLLVSYWDTSFTDNNASQHPGGGLILAVDANSDPIYNLSGQPWRPRIQGYDATFSLQKSDSFTLHQNGKASYVRGQAAKPLFDDTKSYWNSVLPTNSVKVANAGVTLRVTKQAKTSMTVVLGSKAPAAAVAVARR